MTPFNRSHPIIAGVLRDSLLATLLVADRVPGPVQRRPACGALGAARVDGCTGWGMGWVFAGNSRLKVENEI